MSDDNTEGTSEAGTEPSTGKFTESLKNNAETIDRIKESLNGVRDEIEAGTRSDSVTDDAEFKSPESKKAVLADLRNEREKRKELQTELERVKQSYMADATAAAEAKANEQVATHLRAHLIELHAFDDEDEILLTSNDPADLLKQAASLAKKNKAAQAATASTPKPDQTQGSRSSLPLNGDPLVEILTRATGAR